MRVLVTGGAGFVGHAVVQSLLRAEHDVTVLTHTGRSNGIPAGASAASGDLRDSRALWRVLSGRTYDGVCHLAALARVRDSFADPLTYFDVNTAGTLHLLQVLAETQTAPPAIVFASTGAVYGSGAEGRLSEKDPERPDNPYASSKLAAEQLLAHHASTGAVGATTLRCFAIGGACDGIGDPDDTRILPKALAVAAGHADAVKVNGDGSAVREFTHVLDVAEAYRLALESTQPGEHRLYNVGSEQPVSMAQLIETVATRTGRPVPVEHQPPKPEPHTLVTDSTRIRDELGWTSPRSTIHQIVDDAWNALSA